jgi:hypothetical protein
LQLCAIKDLELRLYPPQHQKELEIMDNRNPLHPTFLQLFLAMSTNCIELTY